MGFLGFGNSEPKKKAPYVCAKCGGDNISHSSKKGFKYHCSECGDLYGFEVRKK
jgi:DNA-directed RNA polymerase subunit RPC12/RpoP